MKLLGKGKKTLKSANCIASYGACKCVKTMENQDSIPKMQEITASILKQKTDKILFAKQP